MLRLLTLVIALAWLPFAVSAQELQTLLQSHRDVIIKPSRKTVGPTLDALVASGLPTVRGFLEAWQEKNVYLHAEDDLFYTGSEDDSGDLTLLDVDTGAEAATGVGRKDAQQIKPNGGVRREIGSALVAFQLSDPDIARRTQALDALARALDASQLAPLIASIDSETDARLKTRKQKLANYLQARFGESPAIRVAAINNLADDLSVDGRAVLSQILAVKMLVAQELPDGTNVASVLAPGEGDLERDTAYQMLVDDHGLPALVLASDIRRALETHVEGGISGGVPVAKLDNQAERIRAYDTLVAAGKVPARVSEAAIDAAFADWGFYNVYLESDPTITEAAETAQASVKTRVSLSQTADIGLDAISLASIYFLAAIGLAVTFGVMGVINMAHGEFIMMGAYTGYIVQQIVPDYTLSLIIALPLAFAVTFGAGVAMERLVIRWLYNRPLETLLATFGISIALQQLAKNIFGTQARPLTSPGWLDGAWIINDVIQISYIRIAIFVLALTFLCLLLLILKRTRLGLEVRAVTQNPRMAASMGINPEKIKMLTFGLGSGIAGIAGVAIGLYAKVTSEMGADYIVQSFMTVVVGGVGNVWGTLAGASMIGGFQKGVEWLNPSNTLAAQTYMILFIILFIQFRPKGIVALKGRAAGD
ncbi:urea ABC transporter permease subunit UrtB [Epibacterium ulvae]|uniref:urea ABC transporter permease subunit UrtB n=1 Tax=Epibacterium ulvae TaxID=1156985 RepID=UPI001BFC9F19|nr:urea ABC transporter permease subunit UrtB [Epibacterium ulvae]MBT8155791.1 urea ABC transporter permease subunit UrtB [Epibacterium ulvae]